MLNCSRKFNLIANINVFSEQQGEVFFIVLYISMTASC